MTLFRKVFVVSRRCGQETVGRVLQDNEGRVVVTSIVESMAEPWSADRSRHIVVVIREKPKDRDVNLPNGIDRVISRIQANPVLATRPLVDQRKIIGPRIATTIRLHCCVVFIGRCAARHHGHGYAGCCDSLADFWLWQAFLACSPLDFMQDCVGDVRTAAGTNDHESNIAGASTH